MSAMSVGAMRAMSVRYECCRTKHSWHATLIARKFTVGTHSTNTHSTKIELIALIAPTLIALIAHS